VLDQALTAGAPGADDDVDDALGHACLERQLREAQSAERRQLGGLEHNRVAGGKRRAELPGCDVEREVPGHDQADDPSGSRTVKA